VIDRTEDLDPLLKQMPREASSIAAGAFNADAVELAEAGQPPQ
jgi:hypothetical protein